MDLNKIDPAQLEFSTEELDALAMILTKAETIKADHTLFRLVQKHVEKKVTDFKSIDDLKKHSKRLQEDTNNKKSKPKDNQDEDDQKMSEDAK